jgi:hypothetical protein
MSSPGDSLQNPAALPFTDYSVRIERVFKQAGSTLDSEIIMRVVGHPRQDGAINLEYPLPVIGERNLFFLMRNPDNKTYGPFFGAWSRFNIDQPYISAVTGSERIFQTQKDGEKIVTAEFIQKLSDLSQSATPPTP